MPGIAARAPARPVFYADYHHAGVEAAATAATAAIALYAAGAAAAAAAGLHQA